MLSKKLKSLENPQHPLLGPNIWGLKVTGLLQKGEGTIKNTIWNVMHVLAILFVGSQYLELYLLRNNLDAALKNLSFTMLSTVCIVKSSSFVLWNGKWNDILTSVSRNELKLLQRNDAITKNIMQEYTKYSRFVTFGYWFLVWSTVNAVMWSPLLVLFSGSENIAKIKSGEVPLPEIMSSWLPFDKTKSIGYVMYIIEHVIILFYGGGIIATYDACAVVLMNFFAGQFKLLEEDCKRIFDKKKVELTDEEAITEIHLQNEQYLFLVKCSKQLNSLLSPVMFIYIIICSLMICASAIQLTMDGTTKMQQIWIAEYIGALIVQLFIYCWHSNEVLVMSCTVEGGLYKSSWWRRGVRVRRCIIMLGAHLNRRVVFSAGPFTNLNISTFIAILKGSYSYYAILNKN